MGALVRSYDDVFAANDNAPRHFTSFNGLYAIGNFACPMPSLPCLRGSCHEVTEGAISQLIMQLITCHGNRFSGIALSARVKPLPSLVAHATPMSVHLAFSPSPFTV